MLWQWAAGCVCGQVPHWKGYCKFVFISSFCDKNTGMGPKFSVWNYEVSFRWSWFFVSLSQFGHDITLKVRAVVLNPCLSQKPVVSNLHLCVPQSLFVFTPAKHVDLLRPNISLQRCCYFALEVRQKCPHNNGKEGTKYSKINLLNNQNNK